MLKPILSSLRFVFLCFRRPQIFRPQCCVIPNGGKVFGPVLIGCCCRHGRLLENLQNVGELVTYG